MTKAEILAELELLTPADREEIRARIDELDSRSTDEEFTVAEVAMLEKRIKEAEAHPERMVPMHIAEARIYKRLGQ